MSTAAVSPSPTLPVSPSPRRPSAPSDQEHLIYQWVKLDGHSQSWVAEQFSISQSTVSRIVKR